MYTSKTVPSQPKPAGRMVFVWLTLAVALVHLVLLQGLPYWMTAFQTDHETATAGFRTRSIMPSPAAPQAPEVPRPPVTSVAPPRPQAASPAPPPIEAPAQDTPPPARSDASTGTGTPVDALPADTPDANNAAQRTASPPASAASDPVADTADAGSAPAEPPRKLVFPPSIRLLYDVKGVVTYAYTGGSELLWLNQGSGYNARLQITKFGFNLRTWTSRGDLTEQGLAPLRFGDKTRSEIASHFQRDKGIISFSANTPDSPLLPGAQDYLSSFFQLAGMLAGEPQRYPEGSRIAFQVVNARSAEPWIFRVDGTETIDLPDGPKTGIKLTREHDMQYDTKVELWLAPDLFYVPIRIRLSQGNGDFAELLWRSAQKPD